MTRHDVAYHIGKFRIEINLGNIFVENCLHDLKKVTRITISDC